MSISEMPDLSPVLCLERHWYPTTPKSLPERLTFITTRHDWEQSGEGLYFTGHTVDGDRVERAYFTEITEPVFDYASELGFHIPSLKRKLRKAGMYTEELHAETTTS